MIHTSFQVPSILALSMLSVSVVRGPAAQDPTVQDPTALDPTALDPTAQVPGGQDPALAPGDESLPATQALERGRRLEVVLAPGAEHRFRLRRNDRRSTPVESAAADPGDLPERSLDLRLLVERSGDERVVTASLRTERGHEVVYYVLVDEHAAVERLRRHRSTDVAQAAAIEADPELAEPAVRRYVELALGSGLHARRLEAGLSYELGAEQPTKSGVRVAVYSEEPEPCPELGELALQFQGIGVGAAAQVARFGLRLPESAAGDSNEPTRGDTSPAAHGVEGEAAALERAGVPAGDASYLLADGLLSSLSYRPGPEATSTKADPACADWLEIERVKDDSETNSLTHPPPARSGP